jgi:hypothetical protein
MAKEQKRSYCGVMMKHALSPGLLLLLLGEASGVSLTASPTSLDDGQGVVIGLVDDSASGGKAFQPSHLNAVLASCDRTSIIQRVPHRDAAVAAQCDGRSSQRWSLNETTGRLMSLQQQGDGDDGKRCLDASCFETESSGLFAGDLSLCPDQKRELHGVDWCHAGLDTIGEGFTANEPHAQVDLVTDLIIMQGAVPMISGGCGWDGDDGAYLPAKSWHFRFCCYFFPWL